MDHEFWLERWCENRLGFHQQKVNARLRSHWPRLDLPAGARVFVPLCGKSLDMAWLHDAGHPVLGVELADIAVRGFFEGQGLAPEISTRGPFTRHVAPGYEILAGDYFAMTPEDLEGVEAVYDRAALIALPTDMRPAYASQLARITPPGVPVLLLSIVYDERRMQGPPFSVPESEIRALFGRDFELEILERESGPGVVGPLRARGLETLEETVYLAGRRGTGNG